MKQKIAFFIMVLILKGCGHNNQSLDAKPGAQVDNDSLIKTEQENLLSVDSVDDARQKARNALQGSKVDLAQAYYIKAFGMEPDNIALLQEMAQLYKRMNRVDLVEYCYDLILQLKPEHDQTLEQYGLLLIKLKKYSEAEGYLLKVLASENGKNNWQALSGLGLVKDMQDQYQEAEAYFLQALELAPNHLDVLNNLGYSAYRNERYIEAINYYKKALAINPKYHKVLYNYALLEARIKNYKLALTLFLRLMDPAEANNNTGYIAMKNGDYEQAGYYLHRAETLSTRFYSKAHDNLEILKNLR